MAYTSDNLLMNESEKIKNMYNAFDSMSENIGKLNNTINSKAVQNLATNLALFMSYINQRGKSTTSKSNYDTKDLIDNQDENFRLLGNIIEKGNSKDSQIGNTTLGFLKGVSKGVDQSNRNDKRNFQQHAIEQARVKVQRRKDTLATQAIIGTIDKIKDGVEQLYSAVKDAINQRTQEKRDASVRGISKEEMELQHKAVQKMVGGLSKDAQRKINITGLSNKILSASQTMKRDRSEIQDEKIQGFLAYAAERNELSGQLIDKIGYLKNNLNIENAGDLLFQTIETMNRKGLNISIDEATEGLDARVGKVATLYGISNEEALRKVLEEKVAERAIESQYGSGTKELIGQIFKASTADYQEMGEELKNVIAQLGISFEEIQKLRGEEGGTNKLAQLFLERSKSLFKGMDPRAARVFAEKIGIKGDDFDKLYNSSNESMQKITEKINTVLQSRDEITYDKFFEDKIVSIEQQVINMASNLPIIQTFIEKISNWGIDTNGFIFRTIEHAVFAGLGTKGLGGFFLKMFAKGGGLLSRAGGLFKNIGKVFTTPISKLVSNSIVGAVNKIGAGMGKAINIGGKVGGFFKGLGFAKSFSVIGTIIKGFSGISDIINGNFLQGFSKIASGLLYLVPGVGPFIAGWDAANALLKNFGVDLGDSSEYVHMIIDLLKYFLPFAWEKIKEFGSFVSEKLFPAISENVSSIFNGAKEIVVGLLSTAEGYLREAITGICYLIDIDPKPFLDKINDAKDAIGTFVDSVTSFGSKIINWVKQYIPFVGDDDDKEMHMSLKNKIKEGFATAIEYYGGEEGKKKAKEMRKEIASETKSYKLGLNYVPYDEYPAILHEGEMVLTRKEANSYRNFIDKLKVLDEGIDQNGNPIKGTAGETNRVKTLDKIYQLLDEDGTGGWHYSAKDLDSFIDRTMKESGYLLTEAEREKAFKELSQAREDAINQNKALQLLTNKKDGAAVGTVQGYGAFLKSKSFNLYDYEKFLLDNDKLISKLKEEKLGIRLISGFRSQEAQKNLVSERKTAGLSKHTTGLAFDYNLVNGKGEFIELGNSQSREVRNAYNEFSNLITGNNTGDWVNGVGFKNWDGNHVELKTEKIKQNMDTYKAQIEEKQKALENKSDGQSKKIEKLLAEQLACIKRLVNGYDRDRQGRPAVKPAVPQAIQPGVKAGGIK